MKITLEQTGAIYTLHSYRDGLIMVRPPKAAPNDEEALLRLDHSCLVSGRVLDDKWEPQTLSELSEPHLQPVAELQPEVVLIGTGARLVQPSSEQRIALIKLGIGHEVMDTAAACRTYNVLVAEGRKVVAALFAR